jgi:hypothetical protein
MQISVATEILEVVFAHSMLAARIADGIADAIVFDELSQSIDEISRTVAALLGKPYGPPRAVEPTQDGDPEFNVANAVDDLRQVVSRADALAEAAVNLFDQVIWVEHEDVRQLEHLAHLVSATSEAVRAAVEVGSILAVDLSTRRPGA